MSGIRSITTPVKAVHRTSPRPGNPNCTQQLPPNGRRPQRFGPTSDPTSDPNTPGIEDVDLGRPPDEIDDCELEREPYTLVRTEARFFKLQGVGPSGGVENRRRSMLFRTRLCSWISF